MELSHHITSHHIKTPHWLTSSSNHDLPMAHLPWSYHYKIVLPPNHTPRHPFDLNNVTIPTYRAPLYPVATYTIRQIIQSLQITYHRLAPTTTSLSLHHRRRIWPSTPLPNQMAVGTPSRAISTLSPAPSNLKTPEAMATSAQRLRTSENRLAAKKDLKAKVAHLLTRDRNAIRDARNKAEDLWYRADLEPDVLEEKLVTAAMDKLAERRAAKTDIGAIYSAFENYIPPIVYGKDARGDQERQELIEVQLDMLFGGCDRGQRDEESDDDEPNPYLKKQEGEASQHLDQIPAYVPSQKAAATKTKTGFERDIGSQGRRGTAKATVPESSTTENNDENEEYESLSEDEYESDSTSDTSSSSSSDGESEDVSPIPLMAVTRGQPLPTGPPPPAPSRATISRLKHIRFARRNPNNRFQAVIRGETVDKKKHDADVEKKGVVSRKHGRGETEGLESEERRVERKGKKSKRA